MNKRKIKKKLHLNNKGIDGEIANNTTFDFDFNVEKKESNKLNTEDWALLSLMILFIFAMGVVSGWLALIVQIMDNLKDIQNMTSKLLFFDLETTGVKFWRNGIHQIGGIVDIDGQEAERFDIRLAPNPAATIEQEALDVAGVTLEQVQSYQPMEEGYRQLVGILSKYVNKFDKRDKMYLVGYNNAGFDNSFLRALFQQCGDKYFGSWFYPNCMDVYVMVTPFLMGVRNDMENFKLMTVAKTMGIEIDENKLHDATYDIELTRDIFYKIINKMDVKL